MPDNSMGGTLEDFVVKLIPPNDPTWGHADNSTSTAKSLGAPFSDSDRLKARLHTWLAWRKEPGVPYGRAINSKYFEHDTPEAHSFVAWFCKLYDIDLAAIDA